MAKGNNKVIDDLKDLEPDDSDLHGGHWLPSTSMHMRWKIAYAARCRTAGLSWSETVEVLNQGIKRPANRYSDPSAAHKWIVQQHKDEWSREIERANVDVQNKLLPRKAIQALIIPLDDFINSRFGSGSKSEAGKLAISAANAVSSLLRQTDQLGITDDVVDKEDKKLIDETAKKLQSFQDE